MRLEDTIVAPITGLNKAAVAIVRLSGPDSWRIARVLLTPSPLFPESHRAYYGRVLEHEDGLITFFAEGRSYTGQESAEISIHGSPASVRLVMEETIRQGARGAEPGEFTWRAFAHGRLDLSQAESVRETVEAETGAQLALAGMGRSGDLRRQIDAIRDAVMKALANVEAFVDFSEELGEPDIPAWISLLSEALANTERLLATADSGRILRRGLRIAILGRPNAGKSSLLNALLQTDRAIVSETPGTTRDYIEEKADLGGVPCVLIDTAGLRETGDEIEGVGVKRSRKLADQADLVWYVYDADSGWSPEDDAELKAVGEKATIIGAKADLHKGDRGIPVSSITREGLDILIRTIQTLAPAPEAAYIQERHVEPLTRTHEALVLAIQGLEHDLPHDLISSALREASQALGEITGETAAADMVERIFADFCIGK